MKVESVEPDDGDSLSLVLAVGTRLTKDGEIFQFPSLSTHTMGYMNDIPALLSRMAGGKDGGWTERPGTVHRGWVAHLGLRYVEQEERAGSRSEEANEWR